MAAAFGSRGFPGHQTDAPEIVEPRRHRTRLHSEIDVTRHERAGVGKFIPFAPNIRAARDDGDGVILHPHRARLCRADVFQLKFLQRLSGVSCHAEIRKTRVADARR